MFQARVVCQLADTCAERTALYAERTYGRTKGQDEERNEAAVAEFHRPALSSFEYTYAVV